MTDVEYIPRLLKAATYFVTDAADGYDRLYRLLTDQPATPRPPIGTKRSLPSRVRHEDFRALPPALRILYLQQSLSMNGREAICGRILLDRFREIGETLLGHIVYSDTEASKMTDSRMVNDVVSESMVGRLSPNVIYSEGGLFANPDGLWKIPQDVATRILREGGVIMIADAAHNEMREYKEHYRSAASFLRATVAYGAGDDDPIYACDERRFWNDTGQILCDPAKMTTSSWVRPIYSGVPEILVGSPVRLASFDAILASCNRDSTGTLHSDLCVDPVDACPFASVARVEQGYVVLIAGEVSGDVWLEGCPHNTKWLTNTASFLVAEAQRDLSRRASRLRWRDTDTAT